MAPAYRKNRRHEQMSENSKKSHHKVEAGAPDVQGSDGQTELIEAEPTVMFSILEARRRRKIQF